MGFELTDLSQLIDHGFDEIIDVRSPSEFAEDHLPGAISLPVLDDAERARVGTIYKQESPFLARKIGSALVARNSAAHIESHFVHKGGGYRPLIYCWRGGMRSNALAIILKQVGWRVEVLAGGYKTYRGRVVEALHKEDGDGLLSRAQIVLLDGNTGTAKTELLHWLNASGVQVLDLEGLANHRGSLFGEVAGGQPSQKAFESALAMRLAAFDPAQPILIEAESSRIGRLTLPQRLWAGMSAAPRIRLEASAEERAGYLARTYRDMVEDPARLDATLEKLRPYHPAERIRDWRALAASGDYRALARQLIEHHYDPKYARQARRVPARELACLLLEGLEPAQLEAAAREIARQLDTLAL